jgi:hypothetical protein
MLLAQPVAATSTRKTIAIEIMKMGSIVGVVEGAISLEEMRRVLFTSVWDWAQRNRLTISKHGAPEDVRFWHKNESVDTDQKWEALSATEADFQVTYGSHISSVSLPGQVSIHITRMNAKL